MDMVEQKNLAKEEVKWDENEEEKEFDLVSDGDEGESDCKGYDPDAIKKEISIYVISISQKCESFCRLT